MRSLILYGTLGCHLCEQALTLISPLVPADYKLAEVDISDSDQLIERYGVRIPVVLREDNGTELGWPFDQQQLLAFLS